MNLDIEKLAKTIAESLNLEKFKGDIVGVKVVENEFKNIENGGIGIQNNYVGKAEDKSEAAKNKGGRPKRAGKPINKAFIYDAGNETNTRLQLFHKGLESLGWIRKGTDFRNFQSIFSSGEATARIVWTGDINALAELFKELVSRKKIVHLPEGESIWLMVNARFWEGEGNREFGNERLGATHPHIEYKDHIDTLVKILNPSISIAELREQLQSQQ